MSDLKDITLQMAEVAYQKLELQHSNSKKHLSEAVDALRKVSAFIENEHDCHESCGYLKELVTRTRIAREALIKLEAL